MHVCCCMHALRVCVCVCVRAVACMLCVRVRALRDVLNIFQVRTSRGRSLYHHNSLKKRDENVVSQWCFKRESSDLPRPKLEQLGMVSGLQLVLLFPVVHPVLHTQTCRDSLNAAETLCYFLQQLY